MKKTELKEAAAVLRAVLAAVRSTINSADLARLCGALDAYAELRISSAKVGDELLACFRAATEAGATLAALDQARAAIVDLDPVSWPAIAIRNASLEMALAEESRALSLVTMKSRQDVEAWLARMNDSFAPAEDEAADDEDQAVFLALVSLHAAVSNDLANRARPLPRMTRFAFATRLPALRIADRLYSDASRSEEIVEENKVVHPLFVPASIVALGE